MNLSELTGHSGAEDITVNRVVDDSRLVEPGDVFILDSREGPNPTDYIKMAQERGAAAIICDGFKGAPEGVLKVDAPGAIVAKWAAQTYPGMPEHMVGVTGTNGKTSVAWFYRQLAAHCGKKSAALGTLGLYVGDKLTEDFGFTTPKSVTLHKTLQQLQKNKITHMCMEVSSHALALHRADGVRFQAAAFTNITPDHRDFHGSMDAYFAAKQRLFTDLMVPGGTAVINVNRMESMPLAAVAKMNELNVLTVGTANAELVVDVEELAPDGMTMRVKFDNWNETVRVPLVGRFQSENIAAALGLGLGSGLDMDDMLDGVEKLTNVPGRMEIMPPVDGKPTVVVDYAHTADALQTALKALRPQVEGALWVVFGCGGNRDVGKRAAMGKVAHDLADHAVVTDDNPRNEDAATIRQQVMKACPNARNIGDREEAIAYALSSAKPEDTVLIAGKGHETGQIIRDKTHPFDDREVAKKMLGA